MDNDVELAVLEAAHMGSFGVTLAQKVFVVVSQARVLVVPAEHHASVVQSVMLQSTKPDIEMEGPVGLRDTRVSPEVRPNFSDGGGPTAASDRAR